MSTPRVKAEHDFLAGGGEMGALMRAKDWSVTPLGPPDQWPQSLRSAVSILLPSKAQIVLFWGPDLVTVYNDAYRPVYGAKHPAVLGQPAREAFSEIWVDVLGPLFEGVLRTGEAYWAKDRQFFLVRQGFLEEMFFDVSYDPVRDESGKVGGVFCIVSETTGHVVGERRLRTLRDLGVRTADAGSTEEVFRAALAVLAENAHDIPFAIFYPRDLQAGVSLAGVQAPPASAWDFDAVASSGRPRVLEGLDTRFGALPGGPWPEPATAAVAVPIACPGMEASCGHAVFGISPRRRVDPAYLDFLQLVAGQVGAAIGNALAREEERKRAEALAEIDRAKTLFFSNVSHEFRTPLTLLLGPVEDSLADDEAPLPPVQRERLVLARRNGLRLQKLVNTLLDFSRIEAGRAQANYLPTQLGALTIDLASSFRSAIEKAGLKLAVDCPQLPDLSYVDRDMWEKIVLNLISNAFKFTFEGEIAVVLRQKGNRAELSVRDTGTGISATELPRVFERFHRIEGARSRTHEGTGIGLALVKELVKLHGGTIEVESAPGAGTTFTVSIPQGRAHLSAVGSSADSVAPTALRAEAFVEEALRWLPDAPVAGTGAAGRPRILVADDNADLREYVHRLLSGEYQVETVADGESALAAARARRPDLVIADVMMPGLDGFGLIRELRADPRLRTVPVVVLSARAGEEARLEGLANGADDYVVKPFSARELLVRVGALLRSAETSREAGEAVRESERQLAVELAATRRLQETSTRLISEDDIESLYEQIVNTAAAIMQSDFASMQMLHPERGELRLLGSRGFSEDAKRLWEWVGPASGSSCALALKEGKRCMVTDASTDEYLQRSGTREAYLQAGILAMQSTPLLSRSGELLGMITTHWRKPHRASERELRLFDVLARQAADVIERNHAQARLRESDQRKDEFLAMLSHELRNPLAPIRNAVSLLYEADDDASVREQVRAILDRQVGHMIRLVDDLLDIARISRGSMDLQRGAVRLDEIISGAVETSRPLIEANRHRLEVSLPPEAITLSADRVRLTQVVSNLLNNAAKYTPACGLISVTARGGAGGVTITVRDNGYGIEPQALPGVFEMFVQADSSRRAASGGLGIGLALARQLVELHGGSIEARSEGRGRGSEFTVRLPVSVAPALVGKGVQLSGPESRRRVLVVDDNVDAAESLGMLLRKMGHAVQLSYDGAAAIEVALREPPEIVLLDLDMPRLDGYAVAARLREDRRFDRVPIVALTGFGQEADRRRARKAGFDEHVLKPVEAGALRAALELVRAKDDGRFGAVAMPAQAAGGILAGHS